MVNGSKVRNVMVIYSGKTRKKIQSSCLEEVLQVEELFPRDRTKITKKIKRISSIQ